MDAVDDPGPKAETYNPWTVVDLVFKHLTDQGFQPVLGHDNPATAAAALLQALGIAPSAAPDARAIRRRDDELAALRAKFLPES